MVLCTHKLSCFQVPIGAQVLKVFVYKIQVNPIHTILKYGHYYDFMDGNGVVLESFSQWQVNEF